MVLPFPDTNFSDTASGRALRRACIIAEEAAEFGIPVAKMNDNIIAKKFNVREPPGLILFRRGRHLKYDEDLEDEEEMLGRTRPNNVKRLVYINIFVLSSDWLTAPENMILNDQVKLNFLTFSTTSFLVIVTAFYR